MKEDFLKLEELTTAQLNSFARDKTIFFITVSPLENHGSHLPLGMDFLQGAAVCKGVAEKFKESKPDWNVIVCPVITMGNGLMPGVGSINIRQSVIRDFMVDYLTSLAKQGFKHAFVSGFHGGPSHLVAVDEAVHYVNRKYKTNIIAPFGYYISNIQGKNINLPSMELHELFDQHRGDIHGGMLETSFMLFLRPELVKDYKSQAAIDVKTKGFFNKVRALRKGLKSGYLGYPAKANEKIGEMFLHDAIDLFYQSLTMCMEDSKHWQRIKSLDTNHIYKRTNFYKKALFAGLSLAAAGASTYLYLSKEKT
jgi:creatinine amidohydrolase